MCPVSASIAASETASEIPAARPRVVVCGTFHRATEALCRDFEALKEGCEVLSPATVDFVAEVDGFVLAAHELDREPREVEGAT